ncbi:AfsR/SARP family transcriptional regulator [Catenulispora subtropica]|uniref:BTAD domain-containing putative transcriptional regulator n=1 Tax=Catenulispora subtropica TaxID=450798 RepID=A0ABP5CE53_9ACTN
MRFDLLGPLRIQVDGEPVSVQSPKLRALLAVLLFNPGRPVALGTIQRVLWGEAPPPSATASLHNHVTRLRRLLGAAGSARVSTVRAGYQIRVYDGELDTVAFTEQARGVGKARADGDWALVLRLASDALALWRAVPLSDAPIEALQPYVRQLVEVHVEVLEARFEAALAREEGDGLVSALRQAVDQYPLREAFHVQLMEALFRAGGRAEALEVFQALRRTLVDRLGIEPSARAQRTQQRILAAEGRGGSARAEPTLRAEPTSRSEPTLIPPTSPTSREAAPDIADAMPIPRTPGPDSGDGSLPPTESQLSEPPPRQLPAAPRFFVGRDAETAELFGARTSGDTVLAVVGPGGIGKTALALAWSHRIVEDFPDGQLYVDLHGFSAGGGPVAPADVLAGFLHALGVSSGRIPADFASRAALYRTHTAEKRMLVVLDNAAGSAQVKDLLPGGASCLTVVTSRSRLADLVATGGARPVRLGPLGDDEAVGLFRRRLGADRVADEYQQFKAVAEACAGLPLALAIVAARLSLEPDLATAGLVARLSDARTRLAALDLAESATGLREAFSWSQRLLGPTTARLFAALGLHPAPSISPQAAACLADLSPEAAGRAVHELVSAHLATPTPEGRIQLHDLIHLYAAESADSELSPTERNDIRRRMFDHYTGSAAAADRMINPTRPVVAFPRRERYAPAMGFSDAMDAAAWLAREREVLLAISSLSAEADCPETTWRLSWSLTVFLDRRADWQAQIGLQGRALHAAWKLGRADLQARTYGDIATACWRLGRFEAALGHLARAHDLWLGLDDRAGLAWVERIRSLVHESRAAYPEALEHSLAALGHARAAEDVAGEAMALAAAAWCHACCADYESALDLAAGAVAVHRRIGHGVGAAHALDTMGLASHRLGRHDDALTYYRQAASEFESAGEHYYLANTLVRTAEVHVVTGEADQASDCRAAARAIVDTLGVPDNDPLLRALRTPDPLRLELIQDAPALDQPDVAG